MKETIRVRVTEEMKKEFEKTVKENAHNASQLIRNMIQDYIKENKKEMEEMELRTWERNGYTVEMVEWDYDLKAFEVIQGEETQTIVPTTIEDMNEIIEALDNGEDVDGWEDGNGNTILIEGESLMTRDAAIEKVNEYLEEDVTENFEKAEERSGIDGTPHFYVSNSNNATVRVDTITSNDGMDTFYKVVTDDVFVK